MRHVIMLLIGLCVALGTQGVNGTAAVSPRDNYAVVQKPEPLREVVYQTPPHGDLRAMSAKVATVCSHAAMTPVVYAAVLNRKAYIAESLRLMKHMGGCRTLATVQGLNNDSIVWTGKVSDDSQDISLVIYKMLTIATSNANAMVIKVGFILCWYTDEVFYCF
jgi:hypothetical protein